MKSKCISAIVIFRVLVEQYLICRAVSLPNVPGWTYPSDCQLADLAELFRSRMIKQHFTGCNAICLFANCWGLFIFTQTQNLGDDHGVNLISLDLDVAVNQIDYYLLNISFLNIKVVTPAVTA